MTHIFQLNRLIPLQKSYTAFLPFCPPDKVNALKLELHKLDLRIRKINGMTIEESIIDVPFYFETKQSKANFLNS